MSTYRTLAELANLTQDELFSGIYDNLKRNDEFTAMLIANAGVTDRPAIKLNRLASVPTAAVVTCGDSITSAAISASPFTFNPFTFVNQFDVCSIGTNLYNSYSDVVADELKGSIKGITEKIAADAFAGNGSTSINGMASLYGSTTAATTAGLELSDLDLLIDNTLDKGPNMAFVGTPAVVRAVVRELRAASTLQYAELADTTFQVPQFNGIPVVKSQYATADALYLVNLDTGYRIYVGQSADMNVGSVFSVQEIGHLESSLSKRWRIYCSLFGVSQSSQGLSRLTGIV